MFYRVFLSADASKHITFEADRFDLKVDRYVGEKSDTVIFEWERGGVAGYVAGKTLDEVNAMAMKNTSVTNGA